jgi:Rad3-related DNA helicase
VTEISISVRTLVEFLLRNGDIDNTKGGRSTVDAMQAGSRIHKKLQKAAGSDYEAEVPLSLIVPFEDFTLRLDGRADGIITKKSGVTIDEIKGTYKDVALLTKPDPLHLAQAMCYAYMVTVRDNLESIRVQVTYCNIETEAVRRFKETVTREEITKWFTALLKEYEKWARLEVEWQKIRNDSIATMEFPFSYRKGQKKLTEQCKKAYEKKQFLFLEAPTGCGKTITTLYPAVEFMGEGGASKIFYLTAKTITRTVAADTLQILRRNAVRIKSIVLTAKEKICVCKEPDCNPTACKRAKGHFDRINDCLYACLTSEEELSREIIERYAEEFRVCPFELSLDLSLFADVIICDYNYLYDPHVYLRRFFADANAEDYLFLTDEAHNLVDRARDMYSATLTKEEIGALASYLEAECLGENKSPIPLRYARPIIESLRECEKSFLSVKRKCDAGFYVYEDTDAFSPQLRALSRFASVVQKFLEEEEKRGGDVRKAILNYYFTVNHFRDMWELMGDEYKLYAELNEEGGLTVKLLCMDPGRLLRGCHMRGRGGVLFSATFSPMDYYKDLLGGRKEDPTASAESIFPKENRSILVAKDVTSRYDDRTKENYELIAGYIYKCVKAHAGNYMAFFPSFDFAQRVYDALHEKYAPILFDIAMQKENMPEEERDAFLAKFRKARPEEGASQDASEGLLSGQVSLLQDALAGPGATKGRTKKTPAKTSVAKTAPSLTKGLSGMKTIPGHFEQSLVGFCVMGGIFSEGIDLTGEDLIGVIVAGGGIPYLTRDRELMRSYFDKDSGKGFEYAYMIPGLNKVLQSAGRLIRTDSDTGCILYLEKRFRRPEYECMFPKHMKPEEEVSLATVTKYVADFWSSSGSHRE